MSYIKLSTIFLALLPSIALASSHEEAIGGLSGVITALITIFNQIVVLLFILAIIVFAWGIVKLIASSSNPEQLKKAKGILWWGIIGITVLASIAGLVNFLKITFDLTDESDIKPPQFNVNP